MARFDALLAAGLVSVLATGFAGTAVEAQASDYFAGKTITIYAGRPPGGGVDAATRFVAEFIGRHIPGHPTVLPQNKPGAGGVVLGNYIYRQAKPNGFELAVPGRTNFILSPMTGNKQAIYKLQNLSWIGTAASSNFKLWLRADLGIKTIDELKKSKKQIVIGGSSGRNSDTIIPLILKQAGLPLKVIAGYPGTAEERLALERGELDGFVTGSESFPADFLAAGKVVPVLQTFPEEPGIPTFKDEVTDPLAKSVLTLIEAPLRVGLALIGPPGMNKDVLATLRKAYIEMASSQEFIDAAKKRGFEAGKNPRSGDELEKYLKGVVGEVTDKVVKKYLTYTMK